MFAYPVTLILVTSFVLVHSQKSPNFAHNSAAIVQLSEWPWVDVENECTYFLKNYGAVEVSPPNENRIITNRPWMERYQPISYFLSTRSGDEVAFTRMVYTCNNIGVRVYAQIVLNHMTYYNSSLVAGTAHAVGYPLDKYYPFVPYGPPDFNRPCPITNYNNINEVRNCQLDGLLDLNQTLPEVRQLMVNYLNHLIKLGVAGFNLANVKNMWPADLKKIIEALDDLNTDLGFPQDSRPFIYFEIIQTGDEEVTKYEYRSIGRVSDYEHSLGIEKLFYGSSALANVEELLANDELLTNGDFFAFIGDRRYQKNEKEILNYKHPKRYIMAIAFMLAQNFEIVRIPSTYMFNDPKEGPPHSADYQTILSPSDPNNLSSTHGWICEHRWLKIIKMLEFHADMRKESVGNFWTNGQHQIAFTRGNRGFVAFNNGGSMKESIEIGFPRGTYCDLITGTLKDKQCTGKSVVVNAKGMADIDISDNDEVGFIVLRSDVKYVQSWHDFLPTLF